MDRKKAIGLASSVSLAAAGAVLAVGANFGLFGLTASASAPDLPVSSVNAVDDPTTTVATAPPEQQVIEEVRVVDVPVHVPAPAGTPAATPAVSPTVSAESDDHGHDSDDHSDDDAVAPTTTTRSYVDDDEHERKDDECEVHDDGRVECHDEDD